MYWHQPFFYGGGHFLWQILLIVAVIVGLAALRRRRDRVERAGRDADAEAVALLGEVRSTLSRLEDRVRNLETLLERDTQKRGKS